MAHHKSSCASDQTSLVPLHLRRTGLKRPGASRRASMQDPGVHGDLSGAERSQVRCDATLWKSSSIHPRRSLISQVSRQVRLDTALTQFEHEVEHSVEATLVTVEQRNELFAVIEPHTAELRQLLIEVSRARDRSQG